MWSPLDPFPTVLANLCLHFTSTNFLSTLLQIQIQMQIQIHALGIVALVVALGIVEALLTDPVPHTQLTVLHPSFYFFKSQSTHNLFNLTLTSSKQEIFFLFICTKRSIFTDFPLVFLLIVSIFTPSPLLSFLSNFGGRGKIRVVAIIHYPDVSLKFSQNFEMKVKQI